MNAGYLTQLIEHEEKKKQRAFEDARDLRKHQIGRLIIFSLLVVFVVAFIGVTNPNTLTEALKGIVLFISGVGAGLGVKSYLDRKKD